VPSPVLATSCLGLSLRLNASLSSGSLPQEIIDARLLAMARSQFVSPVS